MLNVKILIGLTLVLGALHVNAAARLGGVTDDSVCDVGRTDSRIGIDVDDFIKQECKNGQILIGSSLVPASQSETKISFLAKNLCRISDIQVRKYQQMIAPSYENITAMEPGLPLVRETVPALNYEREEIRCQINKLK